MVTEKQTTKHEKGKYPRINTQNSGTSDKTKTIYILLKYDLFRKPSFS